MNPTTTRIVAADFVATIRGITPAYELKRDQPWTAVEKLENLQGTKIRLFHPRWGFGRPVEDGLFGDGVEWEFLLDIFTNYRGLPQEIGQDPAAEIVTSDGRQLWNTLEERKGIVEGFVGLTYEGFAPEEDEPHELFGAHQFLVRLLLSDSAG